jgi:hypothetical protein
VLFVEVSGESNICLNGELRQHLPTTAPSYYKVRFCGKDKFVPQSFCVVGPSNITVTGDFMLLLGLHRPLIRRQLAPPKSSVTVYLWTRRYIPAILPVTQTQL